MVKYQVERRPMSPSGKVYRGTQPGDYVSVLSNPYHEKLGGTSGYITSVKVLGQGSGMKPSYVPVGQVVPPLTSGSSAEDYSHVVEIVGEPWLVQSTHMSMDTATQAAATIANALGAENVRIVKVLTGKSVFELN